MLTFPCIFAVAQLSLCKTTIYSNDILMKLLILLVVFQKRGRLKGEIELSSVKAVECVKNETFDRSNCFQVLIAKNLIAA